MHDLSFYTEAYDSLTYTPEQKAALASRAATAAGSRSRKKPVSFLLKAAATAACLLSVLTITAEAAGISTPVSDLLAPLFGKSAAQCEIIDTVGRPVDAKDTDNGVTVQADAILGDGHNVSILFTIRRDDGTPLLPEGVSAGLLSPGDGSTIDFGLAGGNGFTLEFLDSVTGDHELMVLCKVSASASLLGETCTAVFDGLDYWDAASNSYKSALEGTWELSFEMNYENSAVTIPCEHSLPKDDIAYTLREISLSPIGVHISYDAHIAFPPALTQEAMEQQMELVTQLDSVEIVLTLSDGSTLDLTQINGTFLPGDDGIHCLKGNVFGTVIPLAEMETISVGGIVFPINPK